MPEFQAAPLSRPAREVKRGNVFSAVLDCPLATAFPARDTMRGLEPLCPA